MLNHVLVALDETKEAENAIQYAVEFVEPSGTIVLVRIVSPEEIVALLEDTPYATIGFDTVETGTAARRKLSHAEQYLKSLASSVPESITIEIQVQRGRPEAEIISIAKKKQVQAIIMCSESYPMLKYWMFGTVAARILKSSPCPVLLIPHQQESTHTNASRYL